MDIKKELQTKMEDVVTITLEKEVIKECLDEYLDKEFNLKNIRYRFERAGMEDDFVCVEFEDEDVSEIINGCNVIEDSILYSLNKTKSSETLCVFCSTISSVEFIHVMISRKLLED